MRRNLLTLLVMGCVAFGALSYDAYAGGQNPSAALVFPIYSTDNGDYTIITLTNTSKEDTVYVRLVWIDGDDCTPEDQWIELTPRDTFTFLDGFVNPESEEGFLYAYVVDGMNSKVEAYPGSDFSDVYPNVLIGQELVFEGSDHLVVSYGLNAYGFQIIGQNNPVQDEHLFLDGDEYELAPTCIYFPRFFGQREGFDSDVILINLTGGRHFTAKADVLVYNDNEIPFSSTVEYDCYDYVSLTDISNATYLWYLLLSDHDYFEPVGFIQNETGWLELKADYATNTFLTRTIDNAAMLAVLIEKIGGAFFAAADLPWVDVDEDHVTGTLWSTHPLGTPFNDTTQP